jgi:hypothetical protein
VSSFCLVKKQFMGLLDGFFSLSKDVNKVGDSESTESTISELVPELTLDMKDEELINLKRNWLKAWEPYKGQIDASLKENEQYWMGKQFGEKDEKRAQVDNLVFESLETFLPIATRPKADPLVESQDEKTENEVADKVRKMLSYTADRVSYNLKVKQVARYWALYKLGVMKVGWSMKNNDITCVAIRPQKLILDPDATINECEYDGYYIGEELKDTASDLIGRFPDKADFIKEKVDEKMGTSITYYMWTTDDYVFWTLDDEVLGKNKNPHWNYGTQEPQIDPNTGLPATDPTTGEPILVDKPGVNHFSSPKKPYVFLSIFNLGNHPHDDTSLIEQALPLQDLVNKRLKQIDCNADSANNGLIVSGDAFTEEQAKKMGRNLRKGGVVWVPTGDVNNSVKRDTATPLPNFVYESLQDYRNELRNIFGTRGSSAQGTIAEKTVGGKQIIKGQDGDRIGGGISTYLEQFSDKVFNQFTQFFYVYYDEPHIAVVLGKEKAKEYISIVNSDLFETKLLVGVKEGSMIPHDPQSKRDEALQLWTEQGIDPITFFDRLEFPNPRESAKQLYLWMSDPIQLFPDLLQQQQEQQAIAQQQQMEAQAMQTQTEEQKMAQEQANKIEQIQVKNTPVAPAPADYQQLMMNQ